MGDGIMLPQVSQSLTLFRKHREKRVGHIRCLGQLPGAALLRCTVDFGYAASEKCFERLCSLGLDVDVLEDGEIGAMFLGIESTILSGQDDDRYVSGFGLGLERCDEFGSA